jgi:hypothetical protein
VKIDNFFSELKRRNVCEVTVAQAGWQLLRPPAQKCR